jgi:hypothetical protein
MHELVERAMKYATEAHGRIDQRRKYTGQPYDVHLRRVAEIVQTVTDDAETVAAAWLHDTVEDTPATFQDIEREFGPAVRGLVAELTDVSRPSDGNRAVRKAIDREHLARASARAQTVKLADLIDNCTDIVRHDEQFGRVFVAEMGALLEVLVEGDPALVKRARKVRAESARKLGLDPGASVLELPDPVEDDLGDHRAWRLFARAFAARDVAEPLRSFDGDRSATDVAERMRALALQVAGVRQDGFTAGYVRLADLRSGTAAEAARPFAHDQVVESESSLTEVIRLLTRHEHGFVRTLRVVSGVVTRRDIEKPLARMWLFGMITLIELLVVERIRTSWPEGGWEELVPAARLEKARELARERSRRGQPSQVLECLQFSDKAGVLISDDEQLARLGFESRKSAKRVVKELESLRNNLAHAQDIVTHDWAQIARLTKGIEEL